MPGIFFTKLEGSVWGVLTLANSEDEAFTLEETEEGQDWWGFVFLDKEDPALLPFIELLEQDSQKDGGQPLMDLMVEIFRAGRNTYG